MLDLARRTICGVAVAMALLSFRVQPAAAFPAPPRLVIPGSPHFVPVPGLPTIQFVPDLGFDLFLFGGRYYTVHDGAWFAARGYGGPWRYTSHVPRRLYAVPSRYHHHHRYSRLHRYRWQPESRGRHHGHPHGMPPGQAKKLFRR